MPREKQRVEKAKKIVEVSAELVEGEALPDVSEPQSTVRSPVQKSLTDQSDRVSTAPDNAPETPLSTQVSEAAPVEPPRQKTPIGALKSTIAKALPFVLISLLIFSIPFLNAPDVSKYWLNFAQVRTYILCAVIWNLIGAALYAQVDKRLSRIMIIVVFALPLITSHWWATMLYTLEMFLRGIFSAST